MADILYRNVVMNNPSGLPRVVNVRPYFEPLRQRDLNDLAELYDRWVNIDEFMIRKRVNNITGVVQPLALLCSKRGNDYHAKRLVKKLGFLKNVPRDLEFFKNGKVRILWVTLTYDPKRCSLEYAWSHAVEEFNLFITNLRYKYGKVEFVRFPQPFPDPNGKGFGYPHFHLLLLFEEAVFNVFANLEFDYGKEVIRYRIEEREEIRSQANWHSFVDVQALNSLEAAASYCQKYCMNVYRNDQYKAKITNAVLWLKSKQSYSVSRKFRTALHDLISYLHVSKISYNQITLEGDSFPVWEWVGKPLFVAASSLGSPPYPFTVELNAKKYNRLVDKAAREYQKWLNRRAY